MSVPQETLNSLIEQPSLFKRLNQGDWIWAGLVLVATLFTFGKYWANMDGYEIIILLLTAPGLIALGWFWKPIQRFVLTAAVFSLLGIWLYGDSYANGETVFGLKYLFSSQSAVMWMSALFVMATVAYFGGLLTNSQFVLKTGTALTWSAIVMGMTGLMVRWFESCVW